jgi:WD40 repeat protein
VLATGGNDGHVRLAEVRDSDSWLLTESGRWHDGPVRGGVWGRIGAESALATGGQDGTVCLWHRRHRISLGDHESPVSLGRLRGDQRQSRAGHRRQ